MFQGAATQFKMQRSIGYSSLTTNLNRNVSMVQGGRSAAAVTRAASKERIVLGTAEKFRFSSQATPTDDGAGKLNENELIEYVEGKVFEVLKGAAKCKHEKLARTATFEDLGFDSLDGVELVLAMEENFGFDITNNEAEKITSVMDAIQIFHENVLKRQTLTQEPGAEK